MIKRQTVGSQVDDPVLSLCVFESESESST